MKRFLSFKTISSFLISYFLYPHFEHACYLNIFFNLDQNYSDWAEINTIQWILMLNSLIISYDVAQYFQPAITPSHFLSLLIIPRSFFTCHAELEESALAVFPKMSREESSVTILL